MNHTDEMIRKALASEEPLRAEELSMREQIVDSFRGRNRWIVIYIWTFTLIFSGLTFYSLYQFLYATNLMETVTWGVAILLFTIMVALGKIWSWMELNKNSVLREVKRLELAVAELATRVEK